MESSGTLLLRDAPTLEASSEEVDYFSQEQQFNDFYHLFLAKVARLPQEGTVSMAEEKRLIRLFQELLKLKRHIGES